MAAGTLSYTYIAPLFEFAGAIGTLERSTDGAYIPCDLENRDYQAFLEWLAAGNPAPEGWIGPTNTSPATG